MGPSCAVYTRQPLSDALLSAINDHLTRGADRIEGTRKGTAWTLSAAGSEVWVRVDPLTASAAECEEELFALGFLPGVASFRVTFAAALNEPQVSDALARLSADIAALVDGVATRPSK